jgi:hypothetical protein
VTLRSAALIALTASIAASIGCRDVSRFSNDGDDHYEGEVVAGSFVRAGIEDSARMCLVLDASHLQDAPGVITSSDGRFRETPLRPIPQIWHDPLSTLSFGEGRTRNLVYVATPSTDAHAPTQEGDTLVVLSLMQTGDVEVRLLRGAPTAGATSTNVFGVFTLSREKGPCSF